MGRSKGRVARERQEIPNLRPRLVRLELPPAVYAKWRQAHQALSDEHGMRLDDVAFAAALADRALDGRAGADPDGRCAAPRCAGRERAGARDADDPAGVVRSFGAAMVATAGYQAVGRRMASRSTISSTANTVATTIRRT
jgi:hypothetical protein